MQFLKDSKYTWAMDGYGFAVVVLRSNPWQAVASSLEKGFPLELLCQLIEQDNRENAKCQNETKNTDQNQ